MSLTKTITLDKVEFVGKFKTLQARRRTDITENGQVISSSYERDSYELAQVSTLPADLQPYATGVWTDELRTARQAEIDEAVANYEEPVTEAPAE